MVLKYLRTKVTTFGKSSYKALVVCSRKDNNVDVRHAEDYNRTPVKANEASCDFSPELPWEIVVKEINSNDGAAIEPSFDIHSERLRVVDEGKSSNGPRRTKKFLCTEDGNGLDFILSPITSNNDPLSQISLEQLSKVVLAEKESYKSSFYLVKDTTAPLSRERFYTLKCWSKGLRENPLREKKALLELAGSPFIVPLHETYESNNSIYFLTDFFPGGSLWSFMGRKKHLSHEECVFFSANMVSALSYIHAKGYVHRDIKPENFLIGGDGYLKLCDFGLSMKLPSRVMLPSGRTEVSSVAFAYCGTVDFVAPEILLATSTVKAFCTGYKENVDWWSLGCIVVEMYCGKAPFWEMTREKVFNRVQWIGAGGYPYIPPVQMEKQGLEHAYDFVKKLLVKESERLGRNGGIEVQKHKYFYQIDFEKLRKKELRAPYIPTSWDLLFRVGNRTYK